MKRPAAAPAEPAAKRPSVETASAEQRSLVSKALLQSRDFPAHVLEMLSTSLPGCLGMPKERRHPFQEEIAGMVGEVLDKAEAELLAGVGAAEAKLGEARAQKDAREGDERAAAEDFSAKEEALAAAQGAADDAGRVLSEARAALASAEAGRAAGDAERGAAAGRKARLSSVLSEAFLPIKEGSAEPAAAKEGLAAVLAVGSDFSFDATLLKALPSAAQKAFGDRGTFDGLVMDQIEAEFKKHSDAMNELVASAEPAKLEQDAKVGDANGEVVEAKARDDECAAALGAAKTAQKESLASKRAAARAVRESGPEVKQAGAEMEQARSRLEEFRAGPLAAFRELCDASEAEPAAKETVAGTGEPKDSAMAAAGVEEAAPAVAGEAEAKAEEAGEAAPALGVAGA